MPDYGFSQIDENKSAPIGTIGERLKEVVVTYCGSYNFSDDYGAKACYIFKDKQGNELRWYTAAKRLLDKEKHYLLNGTVKSHKEIDKEYVSTILSRCYIKEEF